MYFHNMNNKMILLLLLLYCVYVTCRRHESSDTIKKIFTRQERLAKRMAKLSVLNEVKLSSSMDTFSSLQLKSKLGVEMSHSKRWHMEVGRYLRQEKVNTAQTMIAHVKNDTDVKHNIINKRSHLVDGWTHEIGQHLRTNRPKKTHQTPVNMRVDTVGVGLEGSDRNISTLFPVGNKK